MGPLLEVAYKRKPNSRTEQNTTEENRREEGERDTKRQTEREVSLYRTFVQRCAVEDFVLAFEMDMV